MSENEIDDALEDEIAERRKRRKRKGRKKTKGSGFRAKVMVLSGFILLGVQIWKWLMTGRWPEWDLLFAATFMVGQQSGFVQWLEYPTTLFGLNKLVVFLMDVIAVWFALVFVGGWLAWSRD